MLLIEAALPLCTAIASRCLRKAVERGSPVCSWMRAPMSAQISEADGPQAPSVSIATGWKMYDPDEVRSEYLVRFLDSAWEAATRLCG